MNAIEIMVSEHDNILRMLEVVRKACLKILNEGVVNVDDFHLIIDFIRNYADGHHHNKEEIFLFNRMTENLGDPGEKLIKHGMLVEHDMGRLYVSNLISALDNYEKGNEESKLDIIANAVSYTDLLKRHIDKENDVVYKFAERSLDKEIMSMIDKECINYEKENEDIAKSKIEILTYLEKKYIY